MKTFKFTANGMSFVTETDHFITAMSEANRHWILGSGAWFNTSETEFRWVEGNFFD